MAQEPTAKSDLENEAIRGEVSKLVEDGLVSQLGKSEQDIPKMAKAIFELAKYLNRGQTDDNIIRLEKNWTSMTDGGRAKSSELMDINAEVAYFQKSLEDIVAIKSKHDSYTLYMPGSAGMVRVGLGLDDENKGLIQLVDNGGNQKISDKFSKLFKNENTVADNPEEIVFKEEADPKELDFLQLMNSSKKVIFDWGGDNLWTVKGEDETKPENCLSIGGERFHELTNITLTNSAGTVEELMLRGIDVDIRNYDSAFKSKEDFDIFMSQLSDRVKVRKQNPTIQ